MTPPATDWSKRPGVVIGLATVLLAVPLIAALVDLATTRWYPVLDLAMTEFRVRDAFTTETPLIGLPGRIGSAPGQGSHPGPLSFYLLAPTYRLFGSTTWALEAAAVMVHVAAIVAALWIGWRRRGLTGVIAVGALLAVVMRGYGQVLLTQPWNPYLPLLVWIVVLLAAWSVLDGDPAMVVVMVVAGSFCAQTHVPYLVPAGGLTIAALVIAARQSRRWAGIGVAVGAVLWLPPLIDQAVRDPGNIRKLLDHFSTPDEPQLGFVEGVKLAVRHFDVWNGFIAQLAGSGKFVVAASPWWGALTLAVWLAAAVVAVRVGSRSLQMLHAVVAAALVLGTISMTRIFGLPWYYLTLWAWSIAALAVGAIVWTVITVVAERPTFRHGPAVADDSRPVAERSLVRRRARAGIAVVGVAAVAASTVSFASADIPEPRLSAIIEAVAGPTADALDPDVRYLVRWSDAADMGSPGYGLLDELERRGFDVGADPFFAATVTEHRVAVGAEQEIHLATGAYIAAWREVPGAVEVATYEPRDPEALARYDEVRAELAARLEAEGLGELVPGIDANLFGTSLDPRLSPADTTDFTELLEAGQPVAVFVAPPGSDPLAL